MSDEAFHVLPAVIKLLAYLRARNQSLVPHRLQGSRTKAQQSAYLLVVHPLRHTPVAFTTAQTVHLLRQRRDIRHQCFERLSFNDYYFHDSECCCDYRCKVTPRPPKTTHFQRRWQHVEPLVEPSKANCKKIFYESSMSHKFALFIPCNFAAETRKNSIDYERNNDGKCRLSGTGWAH